MSGFLALFHIWSTRRNLQPQAIQHPGIHSYHEKSSGSDIDPYSDVKRKYVEGRGTPWFLSNKRPERLRENLNELEELLESQYIACVSWRNTRNLQFVLSNTVLVSISIAADSPDIEKIVIDKTLAGKFSEYIFDGVMEENYMFFSLLEKSKLMVVNYSKKIYNERRDMEKISFYEPKVTMIDIPGPSGRRVKRHCLRNIQSNLLCVWWTSSGEEAWPWSPLASDADRANIVLLSMTTISSVFTIDVQAYTRTDGELLDVIFSHSQPNQVLTVEQSQSSSSKYLVESCVYELTGTKFSKISNTPIPIKSKIICQCRNYLQNKIVLVSSNGSLILWNEYHQKAKTTKPAFVSNYISWHPADYLFLLSNVKGDIQIFDIALNCLCVQLISDVMDSQRYLCLSQYFFSSPKLKKVCWAHDSGLGPTPDAVSCSDDIFLVFERGPVGLLRLELGVCTQGQITPVELACEYLKHDQLEEGVALLGALNWNTNGVVCFHCLVLLTDHLFRQPFNKNVEGCIEEALGSFYAPVRPLVENTILQYRDDISRIARRFFHHLLRHKRFEKAFLLAVDIGSKDLFMDIHYLAVDEEKLDLAEASKQRALQIHYLEKNEGLSDVPSDYLSEEINTDHLIEINRQIQNVNINGLSSNDGQSRRRRQVKEEDEPVRYNFEDSDDDKVEDDPVAWALASRSGQLPTNERPSDIQQNGVADDLKLVHFGNV